MRVVLRAGRSDVAGGAGGVGIAVGAGGAVAAGVAVGGGVGGGGVGGGVGAGSGLGFEQATSGAFSAASAVARSAGESVVSWVADTGTTWPSRFQAQSVVPKPLWVVEELTTTAVRRLKRAGFASTTVPGPPLGRKRTTFATVVPSVPRPTMARLPEVPVGSVPVSCTPAAVELASWRS